LIVLIKMSPPNRKPFVPYRPRPPRMNYHQRQGPYHQPYPLYPQPYYPPMYYPGGETEWMRHPPIPRRPRNPNRLEKVLKRTQNYKNGEVRKKREERTNSQEVLHDSPESRKVIVNKPSVPDIVMSGSEDSSSSSSSSSSSATEIISSPSPWYSKLLSKSHSQREELQKTAAALSRLPEVCVDRGVLLSELTEDEFILNNEDMSYNPSSVKVSLNPSENWKRTASLTTTDPIYGEKSQMSYFFKDPPSAKGLSVGHLKKLHKETQPIFRALSLFDEAEDIASQTSKLQLSTPRTRGKKTVKSPLVSEVLPETKTCNDLQTSAGSLPPPTFRPDDFGMELDPASTFTDMDTK